MRLGSSKPVLSSALLRCLGLVATGSSAEEKEACSQIHTLGLQWTQLKHGFARDEDVPYREVVLARRSYYSVAFQDCITADDRGCDGAHALLLKQKEEVSWITSLLKGPHPHCRRFYSTYGYDQTQEKSEAPSRMLLIPRYIRSGASIHRLVIVNILRKEGVEHNYLQLSYEDVPSQCRSSALFKPLQAEALKRREESYGSCTRDHASTEEPVDSDGDTNVVKLAVAAALAEWLGQGACAQVGCGGYSTGHEGMVHAFLLLTPESSRLVKDLMDENALGVEETPQPGDSREFVQTKHDVPSHNVFGHLLHSIGRFASEQGSDPEECRPEVADHTYRAAVSNHRRGSVHTPSDRPVSEMMLLPIRGGFMTVGTLDNAYCIRHFGKHTRNTVCVCSSGTLPSQSGIADSPQHRVMRHRAAFAELMLDVDVANAEAMRVEEDARRRRRAAEEPVRGRLEREARKRAEEAVAGAYEKAKRASALNQLKDEAAEKMADAERKVEEGTMCELDYIRLCNSLRNDYRLKVEPWC